MWHVWGENINRRKVLVETPAKKPPLGRPKRRWGYNIKVEVRGKAWDVDWIDLA